MEKSVFKEKPSKKLAFCYRMKSQI